MNGAHRQVGRSFEGRPEHPRDEQAPRTTTATSAGVSWPDVVDNLAREPALAIVAERHGRDAARPGVAQLLRSGHEISDGRGYSSRRRSERERPAFGEEGSPADSRSRPCLRGSTGGWRCAPRGGAPARTRRRTSVPVSAPLLRLGGAKTCRCPLAGSLELAHTRLAGRRCPVASPCTSRSADARTGRVLADRPVAWWT